MICLMTFKWYNDDCHWARGQHLEGSPLLSALVLFAGLLSAKWSYKKLLESCVCEAAAVMVQQYGKQLTTRRWWKNRISSWVINGRISWRINRSRTWRISWHANGSNNGSISWHTNGSTSWRTFGHTFTNSNQTRQGGTSCDWNKTVETSLLKNTA